MDKDLIRIRTLIMVRSIGIDPMKVRNIGGKKE